MSSHGLLNCYQHHDFQQHFSSLETFVFYTVKPLQYMSQCNLQLQAKHPIKFKHWYKIQFKQL